MALWRWVWIGLEMAFVRWLARWVAIMAFDVGRKTIRGGRQ